MTVIADCWCHVCLAQQAAPGFPHGTTKAAVTFIVCPSCGNKRCPRATHHEHVCTNSNAPGQPGSMYGLAWPCDELAP